MKKSKFLKRAAVFALSAVMTAGVALSAAACGGDGGVNEWGYKTGTPGRGTDPNKLTVYIFCNDSDAQTNKKICNDWMAKYNAANGTNYSVELINETDKGKYFDNLSDYWSANNMYDIIYLAPRYVRTYAEMGSVLNIADYLDTVSADPSKKGDDAKEANKTVFGQIWKNAVSYYSYQKGKALTTVDSTAYTLGQPVTYDAEKNGFYTDASNGTEEVGLYGLPKDYSNFSTGYNNLFFTDAMKQAITSTKPFSSRGKEYSTSVKGAYNETSNSVTQDLTYTQDAGEITPGGNKVIQYAVDGTYTNPYDPDAEAVTFKAGDEANIINVGVPTRYFPFNFFRYSNYDAALQGGDPLALLCEAYTNGEGYVVTIPGFPNDPVTVPEAQQDKDAPYDAATGHITYTYAEYSAFIWAMTYYLNTYDWQYQLNKDVAAAKGYEAGYGGIHFDDYTVDEAKQIKTAYRTVFGGEQYEGNSGGAVGSVLYLLPWLYGNDADLVNAASNLCATMSAGSPVGEGAKIENAADWRDVVGKGSDKVKKMNLDGTTREVDVQYGFNSENFIETYGAFLALASDWNANNGGDSDAQGDNNGWAYFRAGRSLFYGAGSWDGATRNDTHPDVLEFGQMPTPVSENYALYSKIKGANYTMETYSNGATEKGSGNGAANDGVQRTNLAEGLKVYNKDEINSNQILRQDKWGARMDSVGYAVNGQVTNYTDAHAWKAEAAVSLVMALTIDPDSQVALTYAGAQYPNFRNQMEQFVRYQDYGDQGAFKDMLTPEGFSDMKYYKEDGSVDADVKAKADEIWKGYYDLALEMEEAVRDKNTNSKTVKEFLNGKQVAGEAVRYDKSYDNTPLANFTGSTTTTFLAYAMKVLYMIPMTRANREINIRMQYGLNAVRDSTMYTYTDGWLSFVDARGSLSTMLAYTRGMTVKVGGVAINGKETAGLETFRNGVKQDPTRTEQTWETPVLYCLRLAKECQTSLNSAVQLEMNALNAI